MLGHGGRLLLEIVGVAVGGLLVIAAIAAWRLSAAPVTSSSIKPYLEQAINGAGLGFSVQVADAKLGWHRFRPALELDVHDVEVLGEHGTPIGSFQHATLGISLRGLLVGRFFVTELDLDRPQLVIVRDASDHFSVRAGPSPTGSAGSDLGDLPKALASPTNDNNALGHLHRVHIVDGSIVVDDQKLAIAWSAPDVDIDISRNAQEAAAKLSLILALPQRTARFSGEAHHSGADGQIRFALKLSDFEAASVAPLSKVLAPLAALALPVDGRFSGVLDANGTLVNATLDLHGADGRLVLPEYYPEALAIRSADIAMHVDGVPRRLTLDRLAVDFGDARATVNGSAALDGEVHPVELRAALTNVPLARFDALWPHGVGVGGRDWVTDHIPSGVVKTGNVHVVASVRTDTEDWVQSATIDGGFDYEGLEVNYFPPLPPVRAIAGHATFNSRKMDLTIDHGTLGDITVSQGALEITGFDQDDRAIDIDLSIDGPLRTALSVLDTQPLGVIHRLGFDPANTGGHAKERLHFDFPLIHTLLSSQIRYGAKGKLDGVVIQNAVGNRDITDGALDLDLDNDGMSLAGDATLAGVPLSMNWTESFRASDRIHSHIGFKGQVQDSDWKALNLDPSALVALRGPVDIQGQVSIDRSRATTIDVKADLGSADVSVDMLGLSKPAAQPATATATLAFADGILRRVSRLQMQSATAKLSGSVSFSADGRLERLELPAVGGSGADYALTATSVPGAGNAYAISVTGHRFDAAGLLQAQGTGSSSHSPRLDLKLALEHVTTSSGHGIDSVAGTVVMSGSRLERADLKAVAGNGPLSLSYQPDGSAIDLHLAADDAGAALAGLDITGGVRGGTLHLDGTTKGGDGPRITVAKLDMRDFRLTKAPIIARLVNALSPTGFVDLLSGQGLAFDRLEAGLDYGDGKIKLTDGRSAGALGISFEGDVGLDDGKIALKGTVVPVDTLNRIIEAIPVIGEIVGGGSRGGFLGWTYSVSGTTSDPKVSVNPLSMFAPGFLRNLFFLGPSEAAPKQRDANPPAAKP